MHKQFTDDDGQDESEREEEGDKFESKFLNKKLAIQERKKNTGMRIAQLTLSDGINQIEALEDRPLVKVQKFSVGTLIQVQLPCEVRRGILMLN